MTWRTGQDRGNCYMIHFILAVAIVKQDAEIGGFGIVLGCVWLAYDYLGQRLASRGNRSPL